MAITITDNETVITFNINASEQIIDVDKAQISEIIIVDDNNVMITYQNNNNVVVNYTDVDPALESVFALRELLLLYKNNVSGRGMIASYGIFTNADLVGGVLEANDNLKTENKIVYIVEPGGRAYGVTSVNGKIDTTLPLTWFNTSFNGVIDAGNYTWICIGVA